MIIMMIKLLLLTFFDRQTWKPCTNQNEMKRRHQFQVAVARIAANIVSVLTFGWWVWYGDTIAVMKFYVEEKK